MSKLLSRRDDCVFIDDRAREYLNAWLSTDEMVRLIKSLSDRGLYCLNEIVRPHVEYRHYSSYYTMVIVGPLRKAPS